MPQPQQRKYKYNTPTPSDNDSDDDYDDDNDNDNDSDVDTKHKAKLVLTKFGNKAKESIKSGYNTAKTASKQASKVINKNVHKIAEKGKKLMHKNSDDDDDDDSDEYSDSDNHRHRRQQNNKKHNKHHSSSDDSDDYDSDQYKSNKHTNRRHRRNNSDENSNDNNNSNINSRTSSPHKKATTGFFANLFNRNNNQHSSHSSYNNSRYNSDNEHSKSNTHSRQHSYDDITDSIDLNEWDGDLNYLYVGSKTNYNKHINIYKRKQQIYSYNLLHEKYGFDDIDNIQTVQKILQYRTFLLQNKQLVHNGLPGRLRAKLWLVLSGALNTLECIENKINYKNCLKLSEKVIDSRTKKLIINDCNRVLNNHSIFLNPDMKHMCVNLCLSITTARQEIGYSSPLGHIIGFLCLIYHNTDNCIDHIFWLTLSILDLVLPSSYYSNGLVGCRADCQIIKLLLYQRINKLYTHIDKYKIDINMITLKWLLCLYILHLPLYVTVQIFDLLLLYGSNILIQTSLSIFVMYQQDILKCNDTIQIIELLDNKMKTMTNNDKLIDIIIKHKHTQINRDDIIQRNTERQILQNQYIQQLQSIQQQHKNHEINDINNKQIKKQTAKVKKQLQLLYDGVDITKISTKGKVKHIKLYLINNNNQNNNDDDHNNNNDNDNNNWRIRWDSNTKKPIECQLLLNECMLFTGINKGNFIKRNDLKSLFNEHKNQCISLVSAERTLDFIVNDQNQYNILYTHLNRIIKELRQKNDNDNDDERESYED